MKNKSNKQLHFFYLKHTVPSDNPFTPPPPPKVTESGQPCLLVGDKLLLFLLSHDRRMHRIFFFLSQFVRNDGKNTKRLQSNICSSKQEQIKENMGDKKENYT